MPRPKSTSPRDSVANVRLTPREKLQMSEAAAELGFPSLSEYVRHLHTQAQRERASPTQRIRQPDQYKATELRTVHSTKLGRMMHGNSLNYLFASAAAQSVDLIMTSPPFGLVRKKSYGNEDAHKYCEWFRPFAEAFRRVLKPTGSLVIDIGGAWKNGTPTRSLYHFELLLMLCNEFGYHLCQEHYWWNPSKLPAPAEWVNIRRVRVKDAINCVWWLSPTPFPKASNKRVLAPYSRSMHDLLKNGYRAKLRPSGHDISEKFSKDNGGAVPPNLIAIANTESNGRYQEYCKENGLVVHPARYPEQLPEYFIRFLTDPGDLVVDPFGGSCVTGAVAERLKRRWVCCDLDAAYLEGAKGRFLGPPPKRTKEVSYTIYPPCSLHIDEGATRLVADGGRTRQATDYQPTPLPTRRVVAA